MRHKFIRLPLELRLYLPRRHQLPRTGKCTCHARVFEGLAILVPINALLVTLPLGLSATQKFAAYFNRDSICRVKPTHFRNPILLTILELIIYKEISMQVIDSNKVVLSLALSIVYMVIAHIHRGGGVYS